MDTNGRLYNNVISKINIRGDMNPLFSDYGRVRLAVCAVQGDMDPLKHKQVTSCKPPRVASVDISQSDLTNTPEASTS
jgi:hypothetical protein